MTNASALQRNERRILLVTCMGHALCHIGLLVFPGILVEIRREFDLSPFFVTLVPLLGYILLGLGAIPAGLVADRWSLKKMLVVYFFWIAAACGVLVAAGSAWTVMGGLTLLGAGASLYHPVGLALLSHGVELRGRAMGIHGVAGSIGVSLGSPLGMWMVAQGSWRMAYVLVGFLALGSAAVTLRMPVQEGMLERKGGDGENARPQADGTGSLARLLILLYCAMLCGGLSYRALVTVLPTFLAGGDTPAADLEKGGWMTLAVLVIGGAGQLLGGWLSDRIPPIRLYVFLIAAAIFPALCLGLEVGGWTAGGAGILAFFLFSVQPIENNLLAKASPARHRATLYGLKFAPAFGLGALGTPAVGMIWETTGKLSGVFLLIAALLGVMGMLAFIIAMKVRRTGHS